MSSSSGDRQRDTTDLRLRDRSCGVGDDGGDGTDPSGRNGPGHDPCRSRPRRTQRTSVGVSVETEGETTRPSSLHPPRLPYQDRHRRIKNRPSSFRPKDTDTETPESLSREPILLLLEPHGEQRKGTQTNLVSDHTTSSTFLDRAPPTFGSRRDE